MANVNTGNAVRWENGGALKIGTSAWLSIPAGSLEFQPGLVATEPIMDRGQFTGQVLEGDERPSRIRVTARATTVSWDASDIVALARGTSSAGARVLFTLVVDVPDNRGGGGRRHTFADCWMPDGEQYKAAGAGAEADTIAFEFMSLDTAPTSTDYT